jgi:hypothetical protein
MQLLARQCIALVHRRARSERAGQGRHDGSGTESGRMWHGSMDGRMEQGTGQHRQTERPGKKPLTRQTTEANRRWLIDWLTTVQGRCRADAGLLVSRRAREREREGGDYLERKCRWLPRPRM